MVAAMAIFFVVTIFSAVTDDFSTVHGQELPPKFFFIIPLVWLAFVGGWVTGLIVGVVYEIKANRGEWAAYPVIGKWLLPEKISFEQ